MTRLANGSHRYARPVVPAGYVRIAHEGLLGIVPREVHVSQSAHGLRIAEGRPPTKIPSASAGWFDCTVSFEDFQDAIEAAVREMAETQARGRRQ